MRLLTKILFLSVFVVPQLSCRKIKNFFAPEGKFKQPLEVKVGHPCADEDPGWMWMDKECVNINAHFVASTVAYVRTLGEVNQEMIRHDPHAQNPFRDLMNKSLDALYKAIRESGQDSFEVWYASLGPSWEKARDASIGKAFEVPYTLTYDHVLKDDRIVLSHLTKAMGKNFFEIIQTENMKNYPIHDAVYRNALSDAENKFAISASDWNHYQNADEDWKKEFRSRMRPLIDQIMQSRPKN